MAKIFEIMQQFEQANLHKQKWQSLLDECFDYFLPTVDSRQTTHSIKSHNKLYDSTGVLALQNFSASLKYSLFPDWQKWFSINLNKSYTKDLSKDEILSLNQKIETSLTTPFFDALHNSNFDREISQSLLELGIGTGAILVSEGSYERPFNFTAVSIKDLVIQEGVDGEIENVYRKLNLPKSHVAKLWPKAKKIENYPASHPIHLLEATIYNDEASFYDYFLINLDRQEIIWQEKFKISPWVVFRWSKTSGDVYGLGPAMQCLPDIKEANKIKELSLQNAVLNVMPTYMVASDGVINPHTLNIEPGGIIPVRNLQGGSPIMPLPKGSALGQVQFLLQAAQSTVRHTLFNDRLGPLTDKVRSATEVLLRNQSLVKDIGSAFGRIKSELINKVVRRCFYILQKKGISQNLGIDFNQTVLQITSPLAKLQDQYDLDALLQLMPFFDKFPDEFRLSIKTDSIPEFVAKRCGISPNLLRSSAEKNNLASLYQNALANTSPLNTTKNQLETLNQLEALEKDPLSLLTNESKKIKAKTQNSKTTVQKKGEHKINDAEEQTTLASLQNLALNQLENSWVSETENENLKLNKSDITQLKEYLTQSLS